MLTVGSRSASSSSTRSRIVPSAGGKRSANRGSSLLICAAQFLFPNSLSPTARLSSRGASPPAIRSDARVSYWSIAASSVAEKSRKPTAPNPLTSASSPNVIRVTARGFCSNPALSSALRVRAVHPISESVKPAGHILSTQRAFRTCDRRLCIVKLRKLRKRGLTTST